MWATAVETRYDKIRYNGKEKVDSVPLGRTVMAALMDLSLSHSKENTKKTAHPEYQPRDSGSGDGIPPRILHIIYQQQTAAAGADGSRHGEGKILVLAQIESNKKYIMKLTPLHVDPCELYFTHVTVIFACFVCVLV